jgi:predicted transcriptional regulator
MNNFDKFWLISEGFDHHRRSTIEIIFRILNLLARVGSVRKTYIMQHANLNSRSFKSYVEDTLLTMHFLKKEEVNGQILYSITVYGMYMLALLRLLASVNIFEGKKVSASRTIYNAFLRKISSTLVNLGLKHELVADESEQGIAVMRIQCPTSTVKLVVLDKSRKWIALLEAGVAIVGEDHAYSGERSSKIFVIQLGDVQYNLYTLITQSTSYEPLENIIAIILKTTPDIVQEGIETVLKRLNCT